MLRKFLAFDLSPSPRLKVRLATSEKDLEAALKLLHNSYVAAGFMDPHPSGLRVTKYHSLPATSTIVALWDDEVVGTLSLIRRSAFGMPLETIFDISKLTKDGARVFETSSLAVHPRFSGQHGMILFPLIKFLFEYGIHYFGSNFMAIAVNPAWIEFYEAVLGFKRLSANTVDNYSFVKGAPAVGAYVNLDTIAKDLKTLYKNASANKNLYEYLFNTYMPNLELPDRQFKKISDPVLQPEMLDHFFNKRTQTFSTMSDLEVFTLHQLYQDPKFKKVLPALPAISTIFTLHKDIRFETNLSGRILSPGIAPFPVVITDVSQNGVGIITERGLREGQTYTLQLYLDGQDHLLKIKSQWRLPLENRYGLQITEAPGEWKRYLGLHKDDLLRKAS